MTLLIGLLIVPAVLHPFLELLWTRFTMRRCFRPGEDE